MMVHAQNDRLGPAVPRHQGGHMQMVAPRIDQPIVLVTDTIVVEQRRKSEIAWLRDKFGMEVLREGLQGKVLAQST